MSKVEFYKKVADIQKELKAPKSQRNNFGNYNYRSCEDILEGVKPIAHPLIVTLSDEIIDVGGRIYVKATASITDGENTLSATGFAREAENKKGMDDSQITGSTSSYARKYALNGLFCIDDTKDSDFMDNSQSNKPKSKQQDDGRRWYNDPDFEADKQNMLAACVNDGMTPESIVQQLRSDFKVGNEMSTKIISALKSDLDV